MAHASFDGLRVLSLESRRAKEVAKLIRTYGGEPFVVPSMREVPLESNTQALEFADQLMAGKVDVVVFLPVWACVRCWILWRRDTAVRNFWRRCGA